MFGKKSNKTIFFSFCFFFHLNDIVPPKVQIHVQLVDQEHQPMRRAVKLALVIYFFTLQCRIQWMEEKCTGILVKLAFINLNCERCKANIGCAKLDNQSIALNFTDTIYYTIAKLPCKMEIKQNKEISEHDMLIIANYTHTHTQKKCCDLLLPLSMKSSLTYLPGIAFGYRCITTTVSVCIDVICILICIQQRRLTSQLSACEAMHLLGSSQPQYLTGAFSNLVQQWFLLSNSNTYKCYAHNFFSFSQQSGFLCGQNTVDEKEKSLLMSRA